MTPYRALLNGEDSTSAHQAEHVDGQRGLLSLRVVAVGLFLGALTLFGTGMMVVLSPTQGISDLSLMSLGEKMSHGIIDAHSDNPIIWIFLIALIIGMGCAICCYDCICPLCRKK
mmetsp:Transcript_38590/g.70559  ORF Transcript_38590/g.70559 Transcript_38590/m.70559 type:complete len:115 (-) Transcript_38590:95-439(-)